MGADGSLLVLGLGNVLLGDDGLGVEAVERLRRERRLPDDVVAVDGGTLGLALLGVLGDSERAILVDAIAADGPPGTLVRLEGDDAVLAVEQRLSVHQVGVADLLAAARLIEHYPGKLVLLGVVPESIDLRVGCSAAVNAALPALVARVIEECAALGHPLSDRGTA
jgi:hydrogenase maturation protease